MNFFVTASYSMLNALVCMKLIPSTSNIVKSWHLAYALYRSQYVDSLLWRHNECDSVSNHQPHDCLLNRHSDVDQRKHQSSALLALCARNSPGPVNSPHNGSVTRKMFPFDDVILWWWFVAQKVYLCVSMSHAFWCSYNDATWECWCLKSPATILDGQQLV